MENGGTSLAEKQVLVISDNDMLAQVIAWSLRSGLKVRANITVSTSRHSRNSEPYDKATLDLIVVAMSSPANEPVVALARASLGNYIGHIPILIISDKSFQSDLGVHIVHLDFPFVIDKLNDKVNAILKQDSSDAIAVEQHAA
ncbi:MAG: hypothetical protein JXA21_01630 [Anaerolineae bacterium]|nr:hypothetical protein [Anaerolineae bacterium]